MVADSEYNELSDIVYTIDPLHSNYNTEIKKNTSINISGNEYKVLKMENNKENGMQAMAVAPIKNGKVDTSEVVIAYAGTNFDDKLDVLTDTNTVIGGGTSINEATWWKPPNWIDGQSVTAQQFADQIKTAYPGAMITTTGHSLGEYLAMYIAAENKWLNVGFNGPDSYNILSEDAKKWIKNNPGALRNYRNKQDLIGNYGGNGTGAAIIVDMEMGIRNPLDYHQLKVWRFDDNGNVIYVENTPENRMKQIQAELGVRLGVLGELAKKLKASGGNLTASEKIFLDSSEGLIVANSVLQTINNGFSEIVQEYKKAIQAAEELWQTTLSSARGIGSRLTEAEIMEALEAGGASHASIVNEPVVYYEEKIAEANSLKSEYQTIVATMESSINTMLETDQSLAKQVYAS